METILANQATVWFVLGFVLLAIELIAFGFAIGVLLFGGLGALLTGLIVWLNIIPDSFMVSVACFALSTALITVILWKPLKKLQSGSELGNDRSSDLIGHTFTLDSDVSTGAHGNHKFSGINWRVEPSEELPPETIEAGTKVKVAAVSVGVFFVEPA